MKRKEFFILVKPLTDKLYRFSYSLIPDDLQAEQLVIDALNAYLLKENKSILNRQVDLDDKKEVAQVRRMIFKGLLGYLCEIGNRRSFQMMDQLRSAVPPEFKTFYALEPKVRMALGLRYDHQFTVEEIEQVLHMARYEVIEKLHNGRFLLLSPERGITP
jgi:hypothetical protein